MSSCRCFDCAKAHCDSVPPAPDETFGGADMRLARMFLCETCGNKRCPHAKSHLNPCTGSNEPGQPGSLYE